MPVVSSMPQFAILLVRYFQISVPPTVIQLSYRHPNRFFLLTPTKKTDACLRSMPFGLLLLRERSARYRTVIQLSGPSPFFC
jgi:hypothetical protein